MIVINGFQYLIVLFFPQKMIFQTAILIVRTPSKFLHQTAMSSYSMDLSGYINLRFYGLGL